MIVRARAPLRLGLAGGGTDVSPYCDRFGGNVLNATVDRYAYAALTPLNERVVRFVATDQQKIQQLALAPNYLLDGELALQKAVYNEAIRRFNNGRPLPVEISTFCDAPVGSGLGSSSTLVVVMLKAFAHLLHAQLDDYSLAQTAFKIEREDCGLMGGRQDQYSAAFGGFNFMEFYANDRAVINQLRIKEWIVCELEASLVLFFSGVSRESARIIADQSGNVQSGMKAAIDAMHAMKQEAQTMKECVLKGDFSGIVSSMHDGWESKKQSAASVTNPLIEEIYAHACASGALAGKVSGAGGGGFMIFFVPPERRMDVIRSLNTFPGQVSNCHFTQFGAQAWTI